MQYRIHTAPVWDAYRKECACPMCVILEEITARQVSMYLNEAVMESLYRVEVNKKGFCPEHLAELIQGKNACGLALQLSTRIDYMLGELSAPKNPKAAKAAARAHMRTCVICEHVEDTMNRYFETVAKMYAHEEAFRPLFNKCESICTSHYYALLGESSHAGSFHADYVAFLTKSYRVGLSRLSGDLKAFTALFDYRRPSPAGENAKNAVPAAAKVLK